MLDKMSHSTLVGKFVASASVDGYAYIANGHIVSEMQYANAI
jgi:hypothetical protein